MPLNSMTGFASLKGEIHDGSFCIDIKSVNNRFLDINCKLPEFLINKEFEITQLVKNNITRGKVDIFINFLPQTTTTAGSINQNLAYTFADAAIELQKYLTRSDELVPTTINPCELLMLPGVINNTLELDYDLIASQILEKLPIAINMLCETRKFEGQKLKEFLQSHLNDILNHTEEIQNLVPDIIAWQKKKLNELIASASLKVNDDLLEQELIIFAQRVDIAEEINRLKAHVAQAQNILTKEGVCGKKLDFLMQEFNREANTIASKSITTQITNTAIDLKVLIEQMREQVQNIE